MKMGKIFISAAHGGFEGTFRNPGAIASGTTEAAELIATRDLIVAELQARGLMVEAPNDDLSLRDTILWINERGTTEDIALEIHLGAFENQDVRGARAYYIALNQERQKQARFLLDALVNRIRDLPDRGVLPDIDSPLGRLAFCRDTIPPSLYLELGFLTNAQDRLLIQTQRRTFAIALAEGLQGWLQLSEGKVAVPTIPPATPTSSAPPTFSPSFPPSPQLPPSLPIPLFPETGIKLNGQILAERGTIVSGNAYVPESLLGQLGLEKNLVMDIPRLTLNRTTYLQAIGLRDANISVDWDASTRTIVLKTTFKVCVGQVDRIMGFGITSEVQLLRFLKVNNASSLEEYGDVPMLYREEATIEGVNYDIAFCQMCLETNFLRFDGILKAESNDFGGLHVLKGFPNRRLGIRAHIQRLKAYGGTAPLVQSAIDPYFQAVPRGVAPLLNQLPGRWTEDADYDRKIVAILRRLYESAGIF